MTANQYAKKFREKSDLETLVEISNEFIQEFLSDQDKMILEPMDAFHRLIKKTNKKKMRCPDWPWRRLRNLNEKWKIFTSLIKNGDVLPAKNGFEEIIKIKFPVIYGASLMAQIF